MLKFIITAIILPILILMGVGYVFGTVVPAGQIGVRQISFGPWKGFSERALMPGYHWSVPVYSKVFKIPQTIQNLDLKRGDSNSGAVEIQTTDGSSVELDVSVLYRFFATPDHNPTSTHGGPADLIRSFGVDQKLYAARVKTLAVNELRRSLGLLSTSQFYDPHSREKEIETANSELSERLAPFGVKVEAILVRRYVYTEQRIDAAIFQKNLQDQEERLNAAASLLAEARADIEKISAEWDAKIKTLRVQGDNKARVIKSEGDLYQTQKTAEADLQIAEARAEVEKLKAGALASSKGADVYVAKELAPLLSSLRGGIITNVDPYDLNSWAKKFGLGTSASSAGGHE